MEENKINVVKSEQFATFRQVVNAPKETVHETVLTIHEVLREQKFRGKMTVNYSDGGVVNIVTEQVAYAAPGSDREKLLDAVFEK